MENSAFEEKIGYRFINAELLETALTHSSYTREHHLGRTHCNERLEFLGDAFFDAIVGEELFRRLAESNEGALTKLRAQVVCARSLAEEGRRIGIGEMLRLGNGERRSGGADRQSVVADAMEAVIGAVFLDGGYAAARDTVLRLFGTTIDKAVAGGLSADYKTMFQELVQKNGPVEISYNIDNEEGPDHDRTFYVSVSVSGNVRGRGTGKSKKEAEQDAAKHALRGEN
ncbi:MAG: ribonuclease III [Anaerovoracaceae bacterium]|nr:ribonuclease III [Anaerovoracaceae bacterium]